MEAINLTFTFAGPADAADFLAKLTGEDWPGATAGRPSKPEPAPWEEDEADARTSESKPKPSADPWADEATTTRPAKSQRTAQHEAAGTLFPASGEYDKDTPNGNRHWSFGVAGAPDCDCGYPAAKVSGKKGNRTWEAWWCPIGFTKNYRDKCKFSEFV